MADADVAVGAAVEAGPAPGAVEHAAVQLTEMGFGELRQGGELARAEEPSVGLEDVEALELVELLTGGEAGDQLLLLLHHQGGAVLRRGEKVSAWEVAHFC